MRDGFQKRKVATDILHKQSQSADKGWALKFGEFGTEGCHRKRGTEKKSISTGNHKEITKAARSQVGG
jgi:hypothetical protein